MAKPPSQVTLDLIVSYLDRVSGSAYVGYIALDIGYSLRQTEEWVEVLVDVGKVRKLSKKDLRKRQLDEIGIVYELVATGVR